MPARPCARCGRPLINGQITFCSWRCRCRPRIFEVCQCCGVVLRRPRQRKFCSRECANRMLSRRYGPQHPRWQIKAIKPCEWCGTGMELTDWYAARQRFCSLRCKGSWSVRQKRGITRPEKLLADELCRQGIRFQRNAPVGRFTVDFLLDQAPVAIEVDGLYWHALPAQRCRDQEKEQLTGMAGIRLLRFSQPQVEQQMSICIAEVLSHYPPHLRSEPLLPLYEGRRRGCRVPGCERAHDAKDLCSLHIARLRNYGRLTTILTPKNLHKECTVSGCNRKHESHGMCTTHARHLRQYGAPREIRPYGKNDRS